jgi:hypothetical protein
VPKSLDLFVLISCPRQVRSVIFGEHGSLASLALQRGTGSNAEIYRVTAMRHVPVPLVALEPPEQ